MSSSIYTRLALTNLKNNRKTYLPYILTAALTVMMYYIINALGRSGSIPDDSALQSCLGIASNIMVVFAVIFLFYTNSFLIKRRKKELGVYNILGMGKRHIAKMLCVETLLTGTVSIGAGLVFGLVFSRLMYLILLKIVRYDVRMSFEVSVPALMAAVGLFLIIFAMTLAYNLLQIRHAKPVELLSGGSQGEKEPKTRWLLTIFGLVMIGIGYYIALTTEAPLAALQLFFVAVVCVILGTYSLFVAGSIALLKALRRRKNFYYKPNHFTSISGMIYRMKQNGVGLANICILSTMVLVIISSTVSLYVGMEDVLSARFSREFSVTIAPESGGQEEKLQELIGSVADEYGVERTNILAYHEGSAAAVRKGKQFDLASDQDYGLAVSSIYEVYLIPLEDYNQMEGEDATLEEDEVLAYDPEGTYGEETLEIADKTYQVKGEPEELKIEPKNQTRTVHGIYLIVRDTQEIQEVMAYVREHSGMQKEYLEDATKIEYVTGFDMIGSDKEKADMSQQLQEEIMNAQFPGALCESRELSKESFYLLYGGILFIGLYLGIMFLMATVLIIYYKQISEGYDDRERYQIMQKVGMSKREVRRSIRSQVLTVFFLPLIAAFIHIAVAFKVITKLLATLNLVNVPLFAVCTVVTGAVFAVFYVIVFAVTAKEYYKIVN
ncbi:FtsX-like permease family protein [Lachnospiraceae bacterium KGMB03038]|nr:FtsX-like permease family protein [Lachnospiraceae bacterium KGMB03038]